MSPRPSDTSTRWKSIVLARQGSEVNRLGSFLDLPRSVALSPLPVLQTSASSSEHMGDGSHVFLTLMRGTRLSPALKTSHNYRSLWRLEEITHCRGIFLRGSWETAIRPGPGPYSTSRRHSLMGSVVVGGDTGPGTAQGQKQRAREWARGPCPVCATSSDTFCWGTGSAHASRTGAAVLFRRLRVPGAAGARGAPLSQA